MNKRCVLTLPQVLADKLMAHLFPGDNDEHGAVITAGICRTKRGIKLITRDLFLARDGVDYVPGQRGYRMLHANFIREKIMYCRELSLCYLAVHNHSGYNTVGFSKPDLASHERGYPALLDINKGLPVGGLVFAENAIAGDIWLSKTKRIALDEATVVGGNIRRLYPSSLVLPKHFESIEDRQIRLYGEIGQYLLSKQKVGVIGAGGVGALIIEYLAGLGVGEIVTADPDRMEKYNRRRIPYSTVSQTMEWLVEHVWEKLYFLAVPKVVAAKRFVNRFNCNVKVKAVFGDITEPRVADEFKDCDFLFLAADTMQARLMFNALVFQYGIPGYQIGSKISQNQQTGAVTNIFSVVRPVGLKTGCLLCNGLINPAKLQEEALSKRERDAQAYIEESDTPAPSVITLNSRGASQAVDEFMLRVVGLYGDEDVTPYVRVHPHLRLIQYDIPRRDSTCPMCGDVAYSTRGKGDSARLPVRTG